MSLQIFKLEKLRIDSYKDVERNSKAPESFEAMFNPTQLQWKHEIKWARARAANQSAGKLTYSYSEPSELNLHLTLDGTGVDEIGLEALARKSVKQRVEEFMKVAYDYDGTIHEARYLRVSWGAMQPFDCRLCTVNVTYTMFDRDGSPLRAELDISLHSDIAAAKAARLANKQSPDISHARIVRAGDTLPLLTRAIYGSSERYLDVARYNRLDNFRDLQPGQQLLFPPLAVFDAKPSEQG